MSIILKQATRDDMQTVWEMQVEAFDGLLQKYQDYDMSPATESFERIMQKFEQPWTAWYFIVADETNIGAIRVIDKQDGSRQSAPNGYQMQNYLHL